MPERVNLDAPRAVAGAIAATAVVFSLAVFAPARIAIPLIWLLAGAVVILAWVRASASPRYRDLLIAGALLGLAVRSLAAWIIVDLDIRFSDTGLYWYLGTRLADVWTAPSIVPVSILRTTGTTSSGYFVWTALHALVLRDQILTSLSNAVIGTGVGVLIYLLGRRVWDEPVAVAAAWLVWLSSAHIVCDGHSMRDTMAVFGVLAVVYGAHQFIDGWSRAGAIWFAGGLAVLVLARAYVAVALMPALLAATLFTARKHRFYLFLGFAALGIAAGFVLAANEFVILVTKLATGNALFEGLKWAFWGLRGQGQAESAVGHLRLDTPADLAVLIPSGIVRALFAPLPWKPVNIDVWFIPDGIARHCMMPFFFVGLWEGLRTRWRQTLTLVVVLAAAMVLYSIVELGGNLRHNIQFLPYYYLFAAIGWTVAWKHPFAIAGGYAVVSLALWTMGVTLGLAKTLLPVIVALAAAWLSLYLVLMSAAGGRRLG